MFTLTKVLVAFWSDFYAHDHFHKSHKLTQTHTYFIPIFSRSASLRYRSPTPVIFCARKHRGNTINVGFNILLYLFIYFTERDHLLYCIITPFTSLCPLNCCIILLCCVCTKGFQRFDRKIISFFCFNL